MSVIETLRQVRQMAESVAEQGTETFQTPTHLVKVELRISGHVDIAIEPINSPAYSKDSFSFHLTEDQAQAIHLALRRIF